jgi:hypothetical protein
MADIKKMSLSEIVENMIFITIRRYDAFNKLDKSTYPHTHPEKIRKDIVENYEKDIKPFKEELDKISIVKSKVDYLSGGGAHLRLPSKRFDEAFNLLCRERIPFEMKLNGTIRAPEFVVDYFKSNGISCKVIPEDKKALEKKYPLPKKGSGKGYSAL